MRRVHTAALASAAATETGSRPRRRRCQPAIAASPQGRRHEEQMMTQWEYLLLALPKFEAPTPRPGDSAAVRALDEVGEQGWEAVSVTETTDETVVVLLKRAKPAGSG
jgi:hypothetical protein